MVGKFRMIHGVMPESIVKCMELAQFHQKREVGLNLIER
jgi:hypothetical protein